ncbi:hypothetical protein IHV12_22045 [Fictibacillus sp. 7GRE50]|uniref:hypothetical protein n=1 Tax=unclassified Fictibacillus TaxID=2644029 RepID=UPI0018CDD185|nr:MULTISPECIES: hypothetical protein [unclassified Fictibacillus]MBH0167594.1 hypothetical protein [Fictibacillus sp. 7GRE50]MBH0176151.1 hypothetical protein [Fictibacillus sp. 23RED33]
MASNLLKWKKNYLYLFIVFYIIIWPIAYYFYTQGNTSFFYALVPVAVALPTIRRNHLRTIERKEEESI